MSDHTALVQGTAQVLCKSGRFETGQGTCALLCMDQLGDARARPCSHVMEVHGHLAHAALKETLAQLTATHADNARLREALDVLLHYAKLHLAEPDAGWGCFLESAVKDAALAATDQDKPA